MVTLFPKIGQALERITTKLRTTFAPSAQVGAERRLKVFGTTSKKPAIAAGIITGLSAGLLARIGLGRLVPGIATVSGVGGAGGGIPSLARAGTGTLGRAGNILKAGYGRLFAPVTTAGLRGALGSALLAGGSIGLGKYATSGDPSQLVQGARTFTGLTALRLSPIAGAFGLLEGARINLFDYLKSTFSKAPPISDIHIPTISPLQPQVDIGAPNIPMGDISIPDMSIPSASFGGTATFAPSLNPGVSVGTGGFDPSLLLLLLAGGAGAGYLLGRKKKKRKTKKSKKRKHHKK